MNWSIIKCKAEFLTHSIITVKYSTSQVLARSLQHENVLCDLCEIVEQSVIF